MKIFKLERKVVIFFFPSYLFFPVFYKCNFVSITSHLSPWTADRCSQLSLYNFFFSPLSYKWQLCASCSRKTEISSTRMDMTAMFPEADAPKCSALVGWTSPSPKGLADSKIISLAALPTKTAFQNNKLYCFRLSKQSPKPCYCALPGAEAGQSAKSPQTPENRMYHP